MSKEEIFILCVETSTEFCSVSIGLNGDILGFKESNNYSDHSKNLTIFIKEVLDQSHINFSDLKAIAISQGPGSYTGLRIGASVVKGICFGLNIPLIAIDSCQILSDHDTKDFDYTLGVIEAKNNNIYLSIKNHQTGELEPTRFVNISKEYFDFLKLKKVVVNGKFPDNLITILDSLQVKYKFDHVHSTSKVMHRMAYVKFTKKIFANPKFFSLNYINAPNITKKLNDNI